MEQLQLPGEGTLPPIFFIGYASASANIGNGPGQKFGPGINFDYVQDSYVLCIRFVSHRKKLTTGFVRSGSREK